MNRTVSPSIRPAIVCTMLSAIMLICGCSANSTPPPRTSALANATADRKTSPAIVTTPPSPIPFLIHLPGIAGELSLDRSMIRGLRDGGVEGEIQVIDWTENDPGLDALFARKRHAAQAQRVADLIRDRLRSNPAERITITGHSGGAGIAVWALERLPAGLQVENVLLLAPALSPGYDLSAALHHVRGHLYSFTSPNDLIVLGLGTRLFATIDGQRVEAAGRVGFRRPDDANDLSAYERLVPMPYDDRWIKYDNIGDHVGVLARRFSARILAPLITGHPSAASTRETPDGDNAAGDAASDGVRR